MEKISLNSTSQKTMPLPSQKVTLFDQKKNDLKKEPRKIFSKKEDDKIS